MVRFAMQISPCHQVDGSVLSLFWLRMVQLLLDHIYKAILTGCTCFGMYVVPLMLSTSTVYRLPCYPVVCLFPPLVVLFFRFSLRRARFAQRFNLLQIFCYTHAITWWPVVPPQA